MVVLPLIWAAAVFGGYEEGIDIPQSFLPTLTTETVDDILLKHRRSMVITLPPKKFKEAEVRTSNMHREFLACSAVYFKVFKTKEEKIPFFLLNTTDEVMIEGAINVLNCPKDAACYSVVFTNATTYRAKAFAEKIVDHESYKESCLDFMSDFKDQYDNDDVTWFEAWSKKGEL